ncbi:glycosyltransferase [Sphingomonas sp. CCH5-D11]|uniref:glycosyltransferase n=1 Tax=Sphingomonas sp. CCH5-D11 TaxID=1768786 RepID=UPI000833DA22|nr:glycosyltransferase [Sphingomonas sp. CCH5-D11]
MNVLHIVETLKSGGKERQLLELVRGSLRTGVDAHVLVLSNDVQYDVTDIADRVHRLPRRSRWDVGLILRTRNFVKMMRPDVLHSWGTMCSLYAVPASDFGRLPLVCGHIRDAPSRLSSFDKRFWHGKIAERFAAATVANSKAGLIAYRATGPNAHVIYNGFDASRNARQGDAAFRKSLGIETLHAVGMVARFGSHKDHPTFFAAAERVLAVRDDVTFVAVGDGPTLLDWQARFAHNPRIRVLGRRSDVETIISVLTLGVLATAVGDHGEGISNALTEFLSYGKPVIATDDGGNRELVGDHRCGVLVPPADPQAIAVAITRLLDDVGLRDTLGRAGQTAIRVSFSREAMVGRYRDLYCLIAPRG